MNKRILAPHSALQVFYWDSRYATGNEQVDSQHKKLMSLVNQLANGVVNSSVHTELDSLFLELIDYTGYHFTHEEMLFSHSSLPDEALRRHKASHSDFVARVLSFKQAMAQADTASVYHALTLELLGYLVKWLAVHILLDDKSLIQSLDQPANHMAVNRAGNTAEAAPFFDSIDVLVDTLVKTQVSILDIYRDSSPKSKFRLLVENSQDAYLWFDLQAELIWFNQAFSTLCLATGAMQPLIPSDLVARLRQSNGQSVRSLIAEVIRQPDIRRQYTLFLPAGSAEQGDGLELHSKWQPVFDCDGAVVGVFVAIEDVTEKNRHHRRLKLFRAVMDQASDAMFIVDPLSSQILDVNQPTARMLGYSSAELKAMTLCQLTLGLGDASRWRRHVQQVQRQGALMFRDRQRCKDGAVLHVEVSTRPVVFEGVEYLIGIARDISRRVQNERKERLRNRTLSRFLSRNTSPELVLKTLAGELADWLLEMEMPLTKVILHDHIHRRQHVRTRRGQHAVNPGAWPPAATAPVALPSEAYVRQSENGMARYCFVCRSSGHHHADLQLELDVQTHQLSQNEIRAINTALQLARVIFDKYQAEQALRQREAQAAFEARHDSLTGLANRLQLFEFVPLALERARRRGQKAAFVYVDIDHFKAINDRYGHAVGDTVLLAFSRLLQQGVRRSDLVCRLSGDEFLIVLEEFAEAGQIEPLMTKLQRLLAVDIPVHDDETIRIAASMGVAIYPDDHDTLDGLIRCADEAMYQVKQRGRGDWGRFSGAGL